MRLVIMETPYAARTWWGRWKNVRYARKALRDCLQRGEAPFASHLLYTQRGVLRDGDAYERSYGIRAGLEWGKKADATVVYMDRGVSNGMKLGIANAELAGRPIEYRAIEKPAPLGGRAICWFSARGAERVVQQLDK